MQISPLLILKTNVSTEFSSFSIKFALLVYISAAISIQCSPHPTTSDINESLAIAAKHSISMKATMERVRNQRGKDERNKKLLVIGVIDIMLFSLNIITMKIIIIKIIAHFHD